MNGNKYFKAQSTKHRYKNIKIIRNTKRPREQSEDSNIGIPEGPQKSRWKKCSFFLNNKRKFPCFEEKLESINESPS